VTLFRNRPFQRQKKCNHSVDTVAAHQDTAIGDFFVNYEHITFFSPFFVSNVSKSTAEGAFLPPRRSGLSLTMGFETLAAFSSPSNFGLRASNFSPRSFCTFGRSEWDEMRLLTPKTVSFLIAVLNSCDSSPESRPVARKWREAKRLTPPAPLDDLAARLAKSHPHCGPNLSHARQSSKLGCISSRSVRSPRAQTSGFFPAAKGEPRRAKVLEHALEQTKEPFTVPGEVGFPSRRLQCRQSRLSYL
jgi:hypothetical protein